MSSTPSSSSSQEQAIDTKASAFMAAVNTFYKRGDSKQLIRKLRDPDAKEVVEYLMSTNDRNNRTAINEMLASHPGNELIMSFLLQCGVPVDARNRKGETILMAACDHGLEDLVKVLITEHKADVNVVDSMGMTALLAACKQKSLATVELLIEHGADAYAVNLRGETALILASSFARSSIVKFLLDFGLDRDAMDVYGRTALELVFHKEITDLLVNYTPTDYVLK